MMRTVREVKNKILADMPPEERADASVGQTSSGYLIVTEHRVFEIYEYGDNHVDIRVKDTAGFWEEFDLNT